MGRVSLTSLPSMVLANMPVSKTGASMSSMCGVKDDWALFWLRSTKISQTVWLSGSGFVFRLILIQPFLLTYLYSNSITLNHTQLLILTLTLG